MSIAPPPPSRALPRKNQGATAHVRRVTLNLLRHSACCPDELRTMINKLANKLDWQISALTKIEQETLYATVDEDLANKSRDEFVANTDSITDHRHNDTHCKLCGHQHIRFEFELTNDHEGGSSVLTGSQCIETYGLNVDGEGTAEDALRALRGAITRAKRIANREDWREAHPDHEADMAELRQCYGELRMKQSPWKLYRHLNSNWKDRCKRMVTKSRAVLKYYDREGFLTDGRTSMVYGDNPRGFTDTTGLGYGAVDMRAELHRAEQSVHDIEVRWDKFMSGCPRMEGWERQRVQTWRGRAIPPEALSNSDKALLRSIHSRNGSPVLKATAA